AAAGGGVLVLRCGTDGPSGAGFGTGGIATVDLGGVSDRAAAVALEPGGAIVVLGAAVDPGISDIALARLDDTGALDLTFGPRGAPPPPPRAPAPPRRPRRRGE